MDTAISRYRKYWIVFFFALLLSTALERRLAELDFNWIAGVRFENDDTLDGDEIINRLVLIDDLAAPRLPVVAEASFSELVPLAPCARSLLVLHRADSRAPPRPAQSVLI